MSEHPQRCPVCSSTLLYSKPFGYRFNGKWLGGYGCGECGIIFIYPQPTEEEIKSLYSKEYFNGGFRCGHEGNYFNDETLIKLADDSLLRKIQRFKSSGTFLEIGCAGGALLNVARKYGYDVHGVEFSDEAAEFARKKFNIDVFTGDLANAKYRQAMFDIVFMGDVLEHLPDPVDTLKRINNIMKIGGVLVVLCPMQTNTVFSRLGFIAYQIAGKKATVQLPPYHLFEYRSKSVSNLLRRSGFEIVVLDEFAISPSEVSLRGSVLQRVLKKLLQYPNYLVTKILNKFGDRVELYAIKQSEIKQ